jgi:L-iditol 2-dehydrogenase
MIPLKIPQLMRAAVYRGLNDVRMEEVPVPAITRNELLVKVAACGVCPTDIKKIHFATVPPPRIFGHETAGTIVKVGSHVRKFKVGQRVALHHHVPCLKCHSCRHRAFAQCAQYKKTGITAGFEPAGGGFSQYVKVMQSVLPGVVPIPRQNSFLEGAMLEPVNTLLKGVRMLDLINGDTVMVAGQGPIGLMFTRLLKLAGANVIATDLIPARLAFAKKFGASSTCNPATVDLKTEVDRLTKGRGLDAAVIAVPSNSVVNQSLDLLRGGGQLLLFAHTKSGDEFTIDLSKICVQEKQLIGSYSSDFLLQKEVADLVFSRKLDVRKLITHRLPLEKTAEAIQLAARPSADALKVVVTPELDGPL